MGLGFAYAAGYACVRGLCDGWGVSFFGGAVVG